MPSSLSSSSSSPFRPTDSPASIATLATPEDDARAFLPQGLLSNSPPSSISMFNLPRPLPSHQQPTTPQSYQILPRQNHGNNVSMMYGFDQFGRPATVSGTGLVAAPVRPSTPSASIEQYHPARPLSAPVEPKTTTVWTTKMYDEQGHDNRLALWVGNLPPGTTEEELWDFFAECDVTSVRVLTNSRCGFVNMASEEQVDYASKRYHEKLFRGMQIVVRARKTFKFAVVKKVDPVPSAYAPLYHGVESVVQGGESNDGIFRDPRLQQKWIESRRLIRPGQPSRYFVMRSLSELDLELSSQKGIWATQKRNTGILNQAFATAQNVYLIFSVLGSNEWYGVARMESPIPNPRSAAIVTRLDGSADPFAGEFFSIKWLVVDAHLSFSETDHVVNPWNQGSLVKRSVDGTEIHPSWAATLVNSIQISATRTQFHSTPPHHTQLATWNPSNAIEIVPSPRPSSALSISGLPPLPKSASSNSNLLSRSKTPPFLPVIGEDDTFTFGSGFEGNGNAIQGRSAGLGLDKLSADLDGLALGSEKKDSRSGYNNNGNNFDSSAYSEYLL